MRCSTANTTDLSLQNTSKSTSSFSSIGLHPSKALPPSPQPMNGTSTKVLNGTLKAFKHTIFKLGDTLYSGPSSLRNSVPTQNGYSSGAVTNGVGGHVTPPPPSETTPPLSETPPPPSETPPSPSETLPSVRELDSQCSQRATSGLAKGCKAGPRSRTKKSVPINGCYSLQEDLLDSSSDIVIVSESSPEVELVGVRKNESSDLELQCVAVVSNKVSNEVYVLTPASKTHTVNLDKKPTLLETSENVSVPVSSEDNSAVESVCVEKVSSEEDQKVVESPSQKEEVLLKVPCSSDTELLESEPSSVENALDENTHSEEAILTSETEVPLTSEESVRKIDTIYLKEKTTVLAEPEATSDCPLQTTGETQTQIPEEISAVVEETSAVIEEATADVEAPADIEETETTAVIEEAPAVVEETTAVVEETSAVVEETTAVVEETSAVVEETTAVVEEAPALVEETTADIEETTADVEEAPAGLEETTAYVVDATADIEEATADVEEATADVEEATADVEEATADVEEATADVEEATADVEETTADVEETTADIEETTADIEETSADVEETTADVEETTADVEETTADVEETTADVEETTADVEETTADVEETETTADVEATADVEEATADVEEATADVEEATADVEEATADVEETETTADVEEATADIEEATADIEEATADIEETTADVEETTADVEETTADVEEATADVEETTADVEEATADIEEATADIEEATADVEETSAAVEETLAAVVNTSAKVEESSAAVEKTFSETEENTTQADENPTEADENLTEADENLTEADENLTEADENLTEAEENLAVTEETPQDLEDSSVLVDKNQAVEVISSALEEVNSVAPELETDIPGNKSSIAEGESGGKGEKGYTNDLGSSDIPEKNLHVPPTPDSCEEEECTQADISLKNIIQDGEGRTKRNRTLRSIGAASRRTFIPSDNTSSLTVEQNKVSHNKEKELDSSGLKESQTLEKPKQDEASECTDNLEEESRKVCANLRKLPTRSKTKKETTIVRSDPQIIKSVKVLRSSVSRSRSCTPTDLIQPGDNLDNLEDTSTKPDPLKSPSVSKPKPYFQKNKVLKKSSVKKSTKLTKSQIGKCAKSYTQTTLNSFVIRRSTRSACSDPTDNNLEEEELDFTKCEDQSDIKSSCAATCNNNTSTTNSSCKTVTSTKPSVASSRLCDKDLSAVNCSKAESKEMVRLVQDTTPLETYCRRRSGQSKGSNVRTSRRLCSADTLTDVGAKKRLRPVKRNTNNSGSRSDYYSESDESSEELFNGKSNGVSSPVNGISDHIIEKMATRRTTTTTTTEVKFNGDVSAPVTNGTTKSIQKKNGKVLPINGEESEDGSAKKVNGSVDLINDRLDINMLLEISAADRNKFESKKAKRQKKNADWQLISETEKIYIEREEILKNKNRVDTSSDEESDDSGNNCTVSNSSRRKCKKIIDHFSSEESDSNTNLISSTRPKRNKKPKPISNNKDTKKCPISSNRLDPKSSEAIEHTPKTLRNSLLSPNETKHSTDGDSPTKHLKRTSFRSGRNRKPIYDLTRLHEDTDDDFYSFPINSGLGNSPVVADKETRSSRSKSIKENRKRLSDAERLIKDNKEYYQFPETKERLRSHDSDDGEKKKSTKESEESNVEDEEEEERVTRKGTKKQLKKVERCKRKGRSRRVSVEEDHLSEEDEVFVDSKKMKGKGNKKEEVKEEVKEEPIEEEKEIISGFASDVMPSCGTQVDALKFSFEQIPEGEPWYQTYQRQLNGDKNNEFTYKIDALRFILPYEMPKEYFRDNLAKKNLANKKKAELADLARKSPRCHASTMALFGDILPGTTPTLNQNLKPVKKKRGKKPRSLLNKTEDGSVGLGTDRTNTPTGSVETEHFETLDDFIAMEHCMQMVLDAANQSKEEKEEHNEVEEAPPPKKPVQKKKGTKRKRSAIDKGSSKVNDENKPSDSDLFLQGLNLQDDPLAKELDPIFLASMKDLGDPLQSGGGDTFSMSSSDLLAGSLSCFCYETQHSGCPSLDDNSSIDGRTEVSSECMSLVDSEHQDTPTNTKSKKRRKNLTGWPKSKKKRVCVSPSLPPPSDDDDSNLGSDMPDVKKKVVPDKLRKSDIMPRHVLEALGEENERRASSRKRSNDQFLPSRGRISRNS